MEQGMEQGLAKGTLIGRIELLQQLLQQASIPKENLVSLDLDELQRLEGELTRQLTQP
jgi:hypothetical protein